MPLTDDEAEESGGEGDGRTDMGDGEIWLEQVGKAGEQGCCTSKRKEAWFVVSLVHNGLIFLYSLLYFPHSFCLVCSLARAWLHILERKTIVQQSF